MSPTGYSQAGQDRFVLAMLSDDHLGTFVDVGCQWPFAINNTALLEELGWRGIALDREDFADPWGTASPRSNGSSRAATSSW